jgi:hypothetical protein
MTNKEQMQRLKFLVDREAITRYNRIFKMLAVEAAAQHLLVNALSA